MTPCAHFCSSGFQPTHLIVTSTLCGLLHQDNSV
eukprot:CAMPEP_0204119458 /NCGR_PEP_ID=MMETSP0361-20130328/7117_1 /ASSEMBLY_ACC=CAM_ASM_000343 /TAXON_ID=268821 /ORGANISM="Scrippsiella Hangoei, Strain SHTV-5" /LENGTH=33 /DNA_ID= /DNA_START= /DNA_END= /DNA_ORIENTATION=